MKKTIGIAMLIVVVAAGLSFAIINIANKPESASTDQGPDTSNRIYGEDQVGLDSFSEDLAIFKQDDDLDLEIDQAYGDILDLNETALDKNSISKEAQSVDFSKDLDASTTDDAVLSEVDQSLNEAIR